LGRQLISTGVEGLDAVLGGFPKNSLIILAGNPGTGKTILSARFLYRGCVDFGENGVYVSFAENRENFYREMEDFGFNFERLERKGKFRFLDMLTVKEPAVHTILNMIIEEAGRIKAKRLVLDSYSALAQAFKEPVDVRIVLHTILGKLIRMMGCTTILIEEVPYGTSRIGFGVEEFVADGVLKLSLDELEGHRLRYLDLLKLRGTRLKEVKLVFTLDGGFKVFSSLKPNPPINPKPFQPVPDMPGKYSTGSKSLDEVLDGGLPEGSVTLLELNEKVSASMVHLLIDPIMSNFTLQGRGVFVVPLNWAEHLRFSKFRESYGFTENKWTRYTKIILPENTRGTEDSSNIIYVKGEDWREDINKVFQAGVELSQKTGQPNLSIVSLSTLVNLYGENQCHKILDLISTEARKSRAPVIFMVEAGFKHLVLKLTSAADIHLRLIRKHGCLLLYGVNPRTGLYAVEADTSKGYPVPKLTQIV